MQGALSSLAEGRGNAFVALKQREPAGETRQLAWPRASWAFGLLLVAVLVVVVSQLGKERRFAQLLRQASPAWLLVAVVLQALTYLCSAAVWQRVLARVGSRRSLPSLAGLGLVKLFVDQAVPTAGVGGSMLLIQGLQRRGLPLKIAMAGVVVDLISFYIGYALAVGISLTLLWQAHDLTKAILVLAALFSAIGFAIPAMLLRINRHGEAVAPGWLRRSKTFGPLLRGVAEAPAALARDRGLIAAAAGLNFAVMVLDAATLDATLRAVGEPVSSATVFACFMIASVAATVGIAPGGLGTFEGASVAMLVLFGSPATAALAATLLFRGFSFWLPMIPGLWLTRRELSEGPAPPGQ
jgi:uncharacterized protein (TIRG00374 family)